MSARVRGRLLLLLLVSDYGRVGSACRCCDVDRETGTREKPSSQPAYNITAERTTWAVREQTFGGGGYAGGVCVCLGARVPWWGVLQRC